MTSRIARAMQPAAGAGRHQDRDSGMSLVEVLVGIGLFGMLGAVLLALALSTSRVTDDTRELTNVNEEARLAVERLTRELRQANEIVAVHLPTGPNDSTALTFWTDFDGNGGKDLTGDPEVLTYRWQPTTGQLTLTANDPDGTAVTRPLLSANVSAFSITLSSSQWQYDANKDGTTTWQELDKATEPVGNHNDVPDGTELTHIDLVGITMTVLDGPHAQTYTTQVDLRNRNQN